MKRLEKSKVGLGKVRNVIAPSSLELSAIINRVNDSLPYKNLKGDMSTLDNSENIIKTGDLYFTIDLQEVRTVDINLDSDGHINFVNGKEGVSVYVRITNLESYEVFWDSKIAMPDGVVPGVGIKKSDAENTLEKAITILELVKLGDIYYFLNSFYEDL